MWILNNVNIILYTLCLLKQKTSQGKEGRCLCFLLISYIRIEVENN